MTSKYVDVLKLILVGILIASYETGQAETWVDPTRPPHAYESGAESTGDDVPNPRVSAIQIGRQSRHAVINGRAVRVGERLDDLDVVAIESGRVIVGRGGKRIEIPLLQTVTKKPATNKP